VQIFVFLRGRLGVLFLFLFLQLFPFAFHLGGDSVFSEDLVHGQVQQAEGLFRLLRWGSDGGLDEEGGGPEVHGGGGFGVVEDVAEGLEGAVGEGQGFFAEARAWP